MFTGRLGERLSGRKLAKTAQHGLLHTVQRGICPLQGQAMRSGPTLGNRIDRRWQRHSLSRHRNPGSGHGVSRWSNRGGGDRAAIDAFQWRAFAALLTATVPNTDTVIPAFMHAMATFVDVMATVSTADEVCATQQYQRREA